MLSVIFVVVLLYVSEGFTLKGARAFWQRGSNLHMNNQPKKKVSCSLHLEK